MGVTCNTPKCVHYLHSAESFGAETITTTKIDNNGGEWTLQYRQPPIGEQPTEIVATTPTWSHEKNDFSNVFTIYLNRVPDSTSIMPSRQSPTGYWWIASRPAWGEKNIRFTNYDSLWNWIGSDEIYDFPYFAESFGAEEYFNAYMDIKDLKKGQEIKINGLMDDFGKGQEIRPDVKLRHQREWDGEEYYPEYHEGIVSIPIANDGSVSTESKTRLYYAVKYWMRPDLGDKTFGHFLQVKDRPMDKIGGDSVHGTPMKSRAADLRWDKDQERFFIDEIDDVILESGYISARKNDPKDLQASAYAERGIYSISPLKQMGAESLMAINQNTPISNFTTNELTHSSTVQGDFNQASINSSGHQNFEVRGAESLEDLDKSQLIDLIKNLEDRDEYVKGYVENAAESFGAESQKLGIIYRIDRDDKTADILGVLPSYAEGKKAMTYMFKSALEEYSEDSGEDLMSFSDGKKEFEWDESRSKKKKHLDFYHPTGYEDIIIVLQEFRIETLMDFYDMINEDKFSAETFNAESFSAERNRVCNICNEIKPTRAYKFPTYKGMYEPVQVMIRDYCDSCAHADGLSAESFGAEGINTVRCNKCMWEGEEEDLVMFEDEDGFGKGCPKCETDAYLMDLEAESFGAEEPVEWDELIGEQCQNCKEGPMYEIVKVVEYDWGVEKHYADKCKSCDYQTIWNAESFAAEYGKRQRFGKRYVARDTKGKFISNVSVGRSLKADRRSKSKTPARSGFGHKGDSQKGASSDFKMPTDAKSLIGIGAVLGGLLAYLESKA